MDEIGNDPRFEKVDQMFSDIKTQMKRSFQKEVAITKDFLSENHMDCSIVFKDDQAYLKYVGPRWIKKLDVPEEEIVNTPIREFMDGVNPALLDAMYEQLLRKDEAANLPQGDPFTHFIVPFKGRGERFFVIWFIGRKVEDDMSRWKYSAGETTEEKYLQFIDKHYPDYLPSPLDGTNN